MRRTTLAIALMAGLTLSSTAWAQDSGTSDTSSSAPSATGIRGAHGLLDTNDSHKGNMLSFFAFPSYWYGFGFGVGARFSFTLADKGFLPMVNDSFELEVGADGWWGTWGYYSYVGLSPMVEAKWSFYIIDKLCAYAKVGLGAYFAFPSYAGWFPLRYRGGVGVIYDLTSTFSVRAEATNSEVMIGIGLRL